MQPNSVPHLRVIVTVCILAIVGYSVFSVWAIVWSDDKALIGDVGGTWKSFAVLAFGFWIGSSSAGKSTAADQQQQLSDLAETTREMAKSVPNAAGSVGAVEGAERVADAALDEAAKVQREIEP